MEIKNSMHVFKTIKLVHSGGLHGTRHGYDGGMALMNIMVQAWLRTQTHTHTHTHTIHTSYTPWYRHGSDEHHGTGMAMMNTMVQAWL